MVIEFVVLGIGLVLLYFGSEFLVRGAASTALLMAVKPVVIGLTVVAFATSSPELLVSLIASTQGAGGISIGNIIGSNVINIALVLALSAMIKPVAINRQIVSFDLPYMLGTSILLWILCMDSRLGMVDGILLMIALIIFLFIGITKARDENGYTGTEPRTAKRFFLNIVLMGAGLAALVKGADMVVDSAIAMARSIGLSETFIGISIVAFGTSLPELATSAVAASKGESDISVGNVIGSNIFNVCMVMGMVGLLSPMAIDNSILSFEFPAMIAISALLMILAKRFRTVGRLSGTGLCLLFIIYLTISYLK